MKIPALPKSLRIGPFDITVKVMSANQSQVDNKFGYFSSLTMEIHVLMTDQSRWRILEVFLHEISHAIWHVHEIHDADNEERCVASYAMGLAQVMRDNPKLRKWIEDVCSGK